MRAMLRELSCSALIGAQTMATARYLRLGREWMARGYTLEQAQGALRARKEAETWGLIGGGMAVAVLALDQFAGNQTAAHSLHELTQGRLVPSDVTFALSAWLEALPGGRLQVAPPPKVDADTPTR